jgi:Domain of unknown function (DUF4381)
MSRRVSRQPVTAWTVTVVPVALSLGLWLGVAVTARAALPAAVDIRDIHGPIAVKTWRPNWWAVGGGTALVAAAAGVGLWSRRERLRLPADQRALRALAHQRTLVAGSPRAFAIAVSETVREYLEEAYGIHAPRRTTDELLADLVRDRSGPLAAHQFELTEFLRQCDLAKFAGAVLSPGRMNAMLDSAEALVRATAAPRPGTGRMAPASLAGAAR